MFDPVAWGAAVVPLPDVEWCMKRRFLFGHRRGKLASIPRPCKGWTCHECATFKTYWQLHHLNGLLSEAAPLVYVGTVPDSRWQSFRRALSRAHTSPDAWWVQVPRVDGQHYVMATVLPTGGAARFLHAATIADAWEWARTVAMALPGVVPPPHWRRGHEPPERVLGSFTLLSALLTDTERCDAQAIIKARCVEQHGSYPPPVDAEAIVDRIGREVVAEIMADRHVAWLGDD